MGAGDDARRGAQAPSPALEGGIGLSIEATTGPASHAGFGRNVTLKARMLLQDTWDCGSSGESRGKGFFLQWLLAIALIDHYWHPREDEVAVVQAEFQAGLHETQDFHLRCVLVPSGTMILCLVLHLDDTKTPRGICRRELAAPCQHTASAPPAHAKELEHTPETPLLSAPGDTITHHLSSPSPLPDVHLQSVS